MDDEVLIKKAVLHVLDNNSNMPVISNGELEINDELEGYIEKHIEKIYDDPNIQKAKFIEEDSSILFLCKMLNDDENDFLRITADIATKLFNIMHKYVDIPSADLLCCFFEDNGQKHLGILKLNYKEGFTHWVSNSDEGNVNAIIRHKTLLPQDS